MNWVGPGVKGAIAPDLYLRLNKFTSFKKFKFVIALNN